MKRTRTSTTNEHWFFLATLLFSFVFLALKSPPTLLYPPAAFEDGKFMLEYFFHNTELREVARFYASYVSLGPNLMGYFSSQLPLVWVPHGLYVGALFVAAFTMALPTMNSLNIFDLSRTERFGLVFVLLSAPIGNFGLITITTYALWNFLILAFMLIFFWNANEERIFVLIVLFLVLTVAAASHPLCFILLFPIGFRLIKDGLRKRTSYVFLSISAVIVLYLVFWVDFNAANDSRHQISAEQAVLSFLHRVVFESIFTTTVRMHLVWSGSSSIISYTGISLMTIALFTVAIKSPRQRSLDIFLVLFISSLCFSFASTYSRGPFLEAAYSHRYSYVSSYLIIVCFWALAVRVYAVVPLLYKRASFFILLVWIMAVLALDSKFHLQSSSDGIELSQFLVNFSGKGCSILDRDEWSITLSRSKNPRDHCVVF